MEPKKRKSSLSPQNQFSIPTKIKNNTNDKVDFLILAFKIRKILLIIDMIKKSFVMKEVFNILFCYFLLDTAGFKIDVLGSFQKLKQSNKVILFLF